MMTQPKTVRIREKLLYIVRSGCLLSFVSDVGELFSQRNVSGFLIKAHVVHTWHLRLTKCTNVTTPLKLSMWR